MNAELLQEEIQTRYKEKRKKTEGRVMFKDTETAQKKED